MLLILTLAILATGGLVLARRGVSGSDAPERLVALAASQLQAARRDWGMAMAAELTAVRGQVQRWRFACGVLRVAVFPPVRHRGGVLAVAVAGLTVAVAGTLLAARAAPGMSVFAATLGLLLCGYATVVAWRWTGHAVSPARLAAGAAALAGASAAVTAGLRIAIVRPAATTDGTHLFSILLAVALTGCLALVITPPGLGEHASAVLWWALGGAIVSSAAAVLVVAACAAASSHSMPAGARAGVLTAVLGAPVHFAIDMTALLQVHHFVLASPFDVAAYAHSGYPTVASYLISDTLGGYIITGMVLYPIGLTGMAVLAAAAAAGSGRRRSDGLPPEAVAGAGARGATGSCSARSSCATCARPVSRRNRGLRPAAGSSCR